MTRPNRYSKTTKMYNFCFKESFDKTGTDNINH